MEKIFNINQIPTWGYDSLVYNEARNNEFDGNQCKSQSSNGYESSSSNSSSDVDDEEELNESQLFTEGRQSSGNTIYNVTLPFKKHNYEPDFYINSKVSIWKGDITKLNVDVIVNATTFKILHGYGVTKAIVDAGGPEFVAECKLIGGCGVGEVCITKGYRLPAKHVIHTVGPAYQINDKLKSCYVKSLELASSLDPPVSSIAFPCISTGINRFPNLSAANIALNSVSSWLRTHPETSIKRVIFCTYLKTDQEIYYDRISTYFPVTLPKFGTFAFH